MPSRPGAVPIGYHSITPYVTAPSADTLIAFLQAAFDARLDLRVDRDDGTVAHAEVEIGDSRLMLCAAREALTPAPAAICLYVADVDAVYGRALAAGAHSVMEPADMTYGDRHGGVVDPAGNQRWVAQQLSVPGARVEQ